MKPSQTMLRTGVGAALLLVLGSARCDCGDGTSNHVDASGGSGGAGAAGGAGGQQSSDSSVDGTGGGGSPEAGSDTGADGGPGTDSGTDTRPPGFGDCLGVCVESLLAECPRSNMTCVSSTTSTDITHYTTTTCYANGVIRQLVMAGSISTTTVKKANGGICYTASADAAAATEDFFDATGRPVAHLVFGTPPTSVTVTCSDSTVTHGDLSQPGCSDFTSAASSCTQGTCTW